MECHNDMIVVLDEKGKQFPLDVEKKLCAAILNRNPQLHRAIVCMPLERLGFGIYMQSNFKGSYGSIIKWSYSEKELFGGVLIDKVRTHRVDEIVVYNPVLAVAILGLGEPRLTKSVHLINESGQAIHWRKMSDKLALIQEAIARRLYEEQTHNRHSAQQNIRNVGSNPTRSKGHSGFIKSLFHKLRTMIGK